MNNFTIPIAGAFDTYCFPVLTLCDETKITFMQPPLGAPDLVITVSGIVAARLNSSTTKSCAPDNIPNAFSKRDAEWSAKCLRIIF